MTDLTYAALRQIMYQPSAVWLATEHCGDRWLTDQFVMLNVTGHPALKADPDPEFGDLGADWADGPYKLTVSKGMQERDSIPAPDIETWFDGIDGTWVPASPSEWSVAEHPGKAMLWVADGPCLVGESTWTAIKRHYPDVEVRYLRERNFFKFSDAGYPFAFAAGIQIPSGQEGIALAIADLHSFSLTQLATAPTLG